MKTLSFGLCSIGTTGIIGGILMILLMGAGISFTSGKTKNGTKLLTDKFSEALNGAKTIKGDIATYSGNLVVDSLVESDETLVSGTTQYLENQDKPDQLMARNNDEATFTLKASGKRLSGFRLPWQTCNGANEWQIHINPNVPADLNVFSGGGNIKLNLAEMAVSHLSADTGGGSMYVSLPNNAKNLNAMVRTGGGNVMVEVGSSITGTSILDVHSGAGNIVVCLPSGIPARVVATSGMGKVIVDSSLVNVDEKTYQSPDFECSTDKFEITLHSGAGNVKVNTK